MTPPTDPAWTARYQHILGAELRHARVVRDWTRRHLVSKLLSKLGQDVSLQTLATYELGTRSIPHVKLVQLSMVLEISLPELLDRVFRRLSAAADAHADDADASGWEVDLTAASELDDPRLLPLRRWARCRLRDAAPPVLDTRVPTIIRLGRSALGDLTVLCDLDMLELVRRLPRPELATASMQR